MATGKVARRTVVSDVAALLDSPEIQALIAELEALKDNRGQKGYGARALVGACLVKSLFNLPTWTWVAALIKEHPGLQDALGGSPSCWAMYRFSTKLRANRPALAACLDACAASLRSQYPAMGRDVAIDASDLPAFANGQRYVSKNGPKRERFSDPDASWGHRSAISTRKGGGFYGYKLQAAVCASTGLPLAWQVESARHHESKFVAPLIDALHARGFKPETVAMDKGYDNTRVYAEVEERGCDPVIPLRGAKANQVALPLALGGRLFPCIPRHSKRFKALYRGRVAVEREFGRLKHDYGLAPLRTRGLERVALHADLVMLARLSQALARARAVPLAA
jgi:Transposase DDE domain